MKKATFGFIFVMMPFFLCSFEGWASKPFEGVISYKISYPNNKFTESQLAMFPKLMTVTVKGNKALTEINTAMGNKKEIIDYAEKTKIGLIDIMGQKFAVKQTTEEIDEENTLSSKPSIELTSETKMIFGYNCKKAIVTVEDKGVKSTLEVFYSEELGSKTQNFDNPWYKEINGGLMEFTMKTPQFNMKFSVSNIEKKSIPSKLFEIPHDYKVITQEELKSKLGGMGK